MTIPPDVAIDRDPPEVDDEPDDTPSTHVSLSISPTDDSLTTATVHLRDGDVGTPDAVAAAVIRAALGAMAAIDPAHHWAMVCALRDFAGGRS